MRYINMPPDAFSLMESTRAIGYSLQTAIADIIDNSIAAGAGKIEIAYFPVDNVYISILDNGCGMDVVELDKAMQYGGKNPKEKRDKKDLGRFGLGLKTASLSQCNKLIVISKKNGELEGRCWDLSYIEKNNQWTLLALSDQEMKSIQGYEDLTKLKSGTLVVWHNLERMQQGDDMQRAMSVKMDKVRQHLALVFHRYIQGEQGLKKINIFMNDNVVEASDPFLTYRNTQIMDESVIKINKHKLKIVPYMLPYPSKLKQRDYDRLGLTEELQKNQGFYIYRNKRLIVWGTWFKRITKSKLSKLARVQVDIPPEFDSEWILDVKKSSASPPQFICKSLDAVIENMAGKSKRTWEYRGKKEIDEKVNHIWNRLKTRDDGIIYEINEEHPLIRQFIEEYPGCEHKLKSLLSLTASSLPMNQMMIDFNSDKISLENSSLVTEQEIRKMLNDVVENIPMGQKGIILKQLKYTEPFNEYIEILEEYL